MANTRMTVSMKSKETVLIARTPSAARDAVRPPEGLPQRTGA